MSAPLPRLMNRSRRRPLRRSLDARASRRFHGLEPLEPRMLMAGDILATVLHDLNGNGMKDPEEPELENWTVFVDLDRNGQLDDGEPAGLTDADGEIEFVNLPDGFYAVRQVLPPGWFPSLGSSVEIEAEVIDDEKTEVFFFNTTTAVSTIEGEVWDDRNADGIRDGDEPGLAGWTVFIDLNNNGDFDLDTNGDGTPDDPEPSDVTNVNGQFYITGLADDEYKVYQVLQPGWEPSLGYDIKADVIVGIGETAYVDFGNYAANAGSIRGLVWNDFNGNGIREAGEPGLADWTVFLDTDGNGALDAGERSTTTDPAGIYSFPAVPPGDYTVTEILQAGWEASPGYDDAVDVTVFDGSEAVANFANYTPEAGTISGTVYHDLNDSGSQNLGEPGLEGWTLFIDLDNSGTLDAGEPSAVTNAMGDYTIFGAPFGSSVVREIVEVGFRPTAPGTGMQLVTLLNGANAENIDFGNKQRTDGEIRGTVYVDSNRNAMRDSGERGLAGIIVYLDTDNSGTLDAGEPSITTLADRFYTPSVDETGSFEFTHLAAGTYHVRQIVLDELSATPLDQRHFVIDLMPGEVRNGVNMGDVYRPSEIHGVVFDDRDADHVRDLDEPGRPGVTVYVDLDRDDIFDDGEPSAVTGEDGSYSFDDLPPGSYVIREDVPGGYHQTYPTTVGGILWPGGVSNPAVGNVSPSSITASLAVGEVLNETVSLTLPNVGALTNLVDVFLLFDDTGSFTGNSPIVRAAFPQIISALQTNLPGINLAFGVGRLEEYANFAAEYSTGRPFILNQPIIAADVAGFSDAIQAALDRTAPGYGGDEPETDIEALYQLVTGVGFDGNNNGSKLDSGAAGLVSTQVNPGNSGDVPPFSSFTPDGLVLPASGTLGGAGFRAGALPIILTATDTGFAYQPYGETTITGIGGLTLPISALTQRSRPTTPFSYGAGIQQTITGLNALGALVIGLGTNPQATLDPRQGLESIAKLTGAINRSSTTIENGTADPIAPGDPFYFQISSGFAASVANGIVAAVQNAVTAVDVNITLKASDPRVQLAVNPGVINNVGAGQTATFDIQITGDGVPRRFDLQFVREGTNVVLGSIPVVLGTPIPGDGYEYEDLEEGEIEIEVHFGDHFEGLLGDLNFDGLIDAADIDVLKVAVAAGQTDSLFDLNDDSAVNTADIDYMVRTILDTQYGDANLDGRVSITDLSILATNFGGPGGWAKGNFVGVDGVNITDLSRLAVYFGFERAAAPTAGAGAGAADVLQEASPVVWNAPTSNTPAKSHTWNHIADILAEAGA